MFCSRLKLIVLAAVATMLACPAVFAQDDATDKAQAMRAKLKNIIITKISFEDTPVSTVFAFLKERSRQLDPEGTGVNFVLILRPDKPAAGDQQKDKPKKDGAEPRQKDADTDADAPVEGKADESGNEADAKATARRQEPTVTLDFDTIPVSDAVKYVCEAAGLRYKVEPNAVVVLGPGVSRDNLELRFFPVDPRLFKDVKDVQKFFEDKGVTFPTSVE
jgi:hypothetical protein